MEANSNHSGRSGGRRAFTLIEACLATVIVGVGVFSAMSLFAACSRENLSAANMTVAMHLAENIQESMAGLPIADPYFGKTFGLEPGESASNPQGFNDVNDFDGRDFNPPIDSLRQPLPTLSEYTQSVSVWPVYNNDLSANTNTTSPDPPHTTYMETVRVMVRIFHRKSPADAPVEVYRTSWIAVE